MDLKRPVTYRGLDLNSARANNSDQLTPISGIALDTVLIGAVPGIGYTEKRSQSDGRDASDVYLDGRRFTLAGTVYGKTRGETHDTMQVLRSALTPTGAFADLPGGYGYLPLAWEEPTEDSDYAQDAGIRYRPLYAMCRPLLTPEFRVDRDTSGGETAYGAGFRFQAQLEARDPRIYVDPPVTYYVPDNSTGQSGTWKNRGDYPSPLKALFVIDPHTGKGMIDINAGGGQVHITLPISTVQQTIRYDGQLKILTLEQNSIEALRMDLITFKTEVTYPSIPPGTSSWSISSVATTGYTTVPIQAPSRMWFDEAYA